MSVETTSLKEELEDCLTQQLSEIELLKAMYPNPGEIIVSDENVKEISNFINSKSEYLPSNLDIVINISINDMKLEVCVNLPVTYPYVKPDIYIRCNQLNRQQETILNTGISEYIRNNHSGEVCLYTAITWLHDNIELFTSSKIDENIKTIKSQDEGIMFCRMWIYSHHIYNKRKRDDIVKLAKEFDLTGFCLPGKPGVICIEGTNFNCNQWWKIIKSMCWKKIAIRNTELCEYSVKSKQRKYCDFKELQFKNPTNTKQTMSDFAKFMSEHGFIKIFNELFGFENL